MPESSTPFRARLIAATREGVLEKVQDLLAEAQSMSATDPAIVTFLQAEIARHTRDIHTSLELLREAESAVARKVALQEQEREIAAERQERERERAVLYSTLPAHIADRVIRGEDVSGDDIDEAAVFFMDLVGFTTLSSSMSPKEVTILLDEVFSVCDAEVARQYDVWGDTVNMASRMESTGEPGKVQVSSEMYEQLSSRVSPLTHERGASEGGGVSYLIEHRGAIEVKGKGLVETYWVEPA